jgi:hypothetical protein
MRLPSREAPAINDERGLPGKLHPGPAKPMSSLRSENPTSDAESDEARTCRVLDFSPNATHPASHKLFLNRHPPFHPSDPDCRAQPAAELPARPPERKSTPSTKHYGGSRPSPTKPSDGGCTGAPKNWRLRSRITSGCTTPGRSHSCGSRLPVRSSRTSRALVSGLQTQDARLPCSNCDRVSHHAAATKVNSVNNILD